MIVASVSGGKDSVALSLYLHEQGIEHQRVFLDTGWEHPDLYAHLDYIESKIGAIDRLSPRMPDLPVEVLPDVEAIEALVGRAPSGFVRWAVKKGMFPSRLRRYCTQELKIKPFLAWASAQDEDVVNAVGIRAEESAARANLPEREPMPGADWLEVWRPLIRWTEADVIAIHQRHGVTPCPLYLRGAKRVGCWPCIQANKAELRLLASDERRVEAIARLEAVVGQMARARDAKARPALFQAQNPKIVNGKPAYPSLPIADVLEWAQTEHGGRQMALGGGWGQEPGCVRWGMCEIADNTGEV